MGTLYKCLALSFTFISTCMCICALILPTLLATYALLICAWICLSFIITLIGIIKCYKYDVLYASLTIINVCTLIYAFISLFLI
ncbi:Uncharacterised protein [Staphylococcus agnetis]|nr:Uncharacterised protein [Staphylococcus agnetis]